MTCLHCGAATTNGLALCARCQKTLRQALANVSAYYADVARIPPGIRVHVRTVPASTPPPSMQATPDRLADRLEDARAHLMGWARCLADDRPQAGQPPTDPADSVQHIAGWLERHVTTIATLEWAGEVMRTTLRSERRLREVLDNTDTGTSVGACGYEIGTDENDQPVLCERRLFATPSLSWIRCPECGATWDVRQRKRDRLRKSREKLLPLAEIARLVVAYSDEVSYEKTLRRVQYWAEKGRLIWSGVEQINGRPTRVYRVGAVLDLMEPATLRVG